MKPTLTIQNKGMAGLVTTVDGDKATATAVAGTPSPTTSPEGGDISVFLNGERIEVGDGSKVGVPCYFSGDGGTTARALASVALGDFLYWQGSIAGFQIEVSDQFDFEYLIDA